MSILAAPFLPQSHDGIIDESELDKSILIIKIEQYESINIGDVIIVYLNQYLSSIPIDITTNNISFPYYETTIPFSTIPLGSYNIFYTITDFAGNSSKSVTSSVTIKKSDPSPSTIITSLKAEVLANGTQANGYTPNSVVITALDEKKKAVPNTSIHIIANDNTHITPSSGVTNQDGQFVFCATSCSDGISSIKIISKDINNKIELYFSPVNKARVIITGREKFGEEYETITVQIFDENTKNPIKNSIVNYKIDRAEDISNILEVALNPDTIRSMITDEIGQFKINFKGKEEGGCIIMVTANNYVGSIKYIMGQQ